MSKRMEKWVCQLMAGLDEHVDKATLAEILEQCGRQCQSQSFIKKARGIYEKSKDVGEFLEKFAKIYKHLHKEGHDFHLVYPKCYCSIVSKIPSGKLSSTYCNCSRGWAKALFEGVLERPVDVIMEKSIRQGDKQCRFKIVI